MIKRVDTDGSGDIDYNEFLKGSVSNERLLTEQKLEAAFRLFDANGDNMISMQEIKAVLDQWKDIDQALVEKTLKDIGKSVQNKNAFLSFQEFKDFIKRLFA